MIFKAQLNKSFCVFFIKQRLIKVTTPSKYWGPALVKHRKLVTHLPNFTIDPWNDDDTALKTKTALSTSPYGIHSVKV